MKDQVRCRRDEMPTARMAAALMALHVAPHAERLAAAGVGTAERLLARVGVRVDLETRRPRERFVARHALVAVLGAWIAG